jgi:hypothetical protein
VRVRHMCAALVILPLLEASWHRCILEVTYLTHQGRQFCHLFCEKRGKIDRNASIMDFTQFFAASDTSLFTSPRCLFLKQLEPALE